MNRTLEKYSIYPKAIKIKNNAKIIEAEDNKYVIKKNKKAVYDIYNYLENRNFHNFPRVITPSTSNYEITEFIDGIDIGKEQKVQDMIYLLTVLHNKTTYFKETDLDDIKKEYEKYLSHFNYLYSYYMDLQNMIEEEIYMSPSSYLLIRNISSIYYLLNIGKEYLEKWYEAVKTKKTLRYVLNHNNLTTDHLIENNNLYFISWDRGNFGYPPDDLKNVYINNYDYLDLTTILSLYESKYKLYDYEYYYLIFNLCDISKLDIRKDEAKKITDVYRLVRYVSQLLTSILKQNSKEPNN